MRLFLPAGFLGAPLLAAALWLAGASLVRAETAGALSLTLTPVVEDGLIEAIHVKARLDAEATREISSLSIYDDFGPLLGIGGRIGGLAARDGRGALRLRETAATLTETPFVISRRSWTPARPPKGALAYEFTAAVSKESATGPVWELRSEPKGASGSGQAFLVLPDSEASFTVDIDWNLSRLGDGAWALTSFPHPDGEAPATLERLGTSFFMVGDLVSYPEDLAAAGPFRAASTTDGAIDQRALLDWTKRAYDAFIDFFEAPAAPPFTVFVRENPFNGMGGTAFPQALVSTLSETTSPEEMDFLMAHEMAHVFLSGLTGEGGWFNEGIAVQYQRRLPLMAGLVEPAAFLADVNDTARRYYSNVRNDLPMKEAQDLFWFDARGRILPYDRGALYFAATDAKIRDASNGARSLDDVIREILRRKRAGEDVDLDGYLSIVARDLGDTARADYEAMMAGDLIVPASDAFGPCFRRTATAMPSFELGFEIYSLMKTPRIIEGLDPASRAAKAGLREGDHVVNPMVIDAVQTDPSAPLVLTVERNGTRTDISFRPEGPLRDGYLWERVEGVPDTDCRF